MQNKKKESDSLSRLIERLKADFPDLRFVFGQKFAFRPSRTVVLGPLEPRAELLLLHEVSHAILKHKGFRTDVERLRMENMAWEKARELAERYEVEFDDDTVQRELDTYRDWLHRKSLCQKCKLTRFQTPDGTYHCPRCENLD